MHNTTAVSPVGRFVIHVYAARDASVGTELVRVLAADAGRRSAAGDADATADEVETAEDAVPW